MKNNSTIALLTTAYHNRPPPTLPARPSPTSATNSACGVSSPLRPDDVLFHLRPAQSKNFLLLLLLLLLLRHLLRHLRHPRHLAQPTATNPPTPLPPLGGGGGGGGGGGKEEEREGVRFLAIAGQRR